MYDSNGNYNDSYRAFGGGTLGYPTPTDGLSYFDNDGVLRSISVSSELVAVSTHLCSFKNFSGSNDTCQEYNGTWTVPHIITLPDGLKYVIEYVQNDGGQISSITFPTGAVVSYKYVSPPDGFFDGKRVQTRTLTVGDQVSAWNYTYAGDPLHVSTSTVVDPTGAYVVYTCVAIASIYSSDSIDASNAPPCYGTSEKSYDANKTLLKTVTTDYDSVHTGAVLPIRKTTKWEASNQVSKVEMDYETISADIFPNGVLGPISAPVTWGNIAALREYDLGTSSPGALLKQTFYSYLHTDTSVNPNSNHDLYRARNIADRPTAEIIKDGSGTMIAQTRYYYDESALVGTTGAANHDYQNFNAANTIRGNLTRISRWDNSTNTWLDATYTYDDLGNRRSSKDSRNNTTTYDYADVFTGANCNASSPSFAFATTITDAKGFQAKQSYSGCTGLLVASRSQNDINIGRAGTTFTYDLLKRPTVTSHPDLGSTTLNYGGTASNDYQDPLPLTVTRTQTRDLGGNSLVSTTVMDGLGRTAQTTNPANASGETKFDLFGRVYSVSNLHFSAAGTTDGISVYTYDALGRTIVQRQADGGLLQWCYDNSIADVRQTTCLPRAGGATAGTWADFTDEAGFHWQKTLNVNGRIASVLEFNSGSKSGVNETDYQYDSLGNLTHVDQWGGPNGSPGVHRRLFSFDSLSRLTQSNNPETGTTLYTYLTNGKLCSGDAALACAKTDARGITVSYAYDALNRLTGKTYPAGSTTPSSCYSYDEPVSPSGVKISNAIGRLTTEWTQIGPCAGSRPASFLTSRSILAYDPMGRATGEEQCTPANCTSGTKYALNYTYDLAGNVTQAGDGIGATLWQPKYDAAGRLSTVTGMTALGGPRYPTQLFNATEYGPFGLTKWLMGGTSANDPALNFTKSYDNRMRVAGQQVTGVIQ